MMRHLLLRVVFLFFANGGLALPAPGVRILDYLHANGLSTWITRPQPVKGVYLFSRYSGGVDQAVIDIVRQGYNTILMSFLTSDGLVGAALSWQKLNATARAAALDFAHWNGAVLLLSVGGAGDYPYAQDAVYYGQNAAWWAYELGFDGVDFDLENVNVGFKYSKANLSDTQLVDWFVSASVAARSALGSGNCGGIISHTPQAPYFGPVGGVGYWAGPTGGFTAVYKALTLAVPPAVDFLIGQFYNQGPTCYFSYESVFLDSTAGGCWAPSTSLSEIETFGVPVSVITLAKPMLPGDNPDSLGLVSPYDIGGWITRARLAGLWTAGVVVWQSSEEYGGAWLDTVYPRSLALNVTAVGGEMTATMTCDAVRPSPSRLPSPSRVIVNATAAGAAAQGSTVQWAAIGGALGGIGGFILLCLCFLACCCGGDKESTEKKAPPPHQQPPTDATSAAGGSHPPAVTDAVVSVPGGGRRGSAGSIPAGRRGSAGSVPARSPTRDSDPNPPLDGGGAGPSDVRAYPHRGGGGDRRRSGGARPPPPAAEDADFDAVPVAPGLAPDLGPAVVQRGGGYAPGRRRSSGASRGSDNWGGRRGSPLAPGASPPLAASHIDGSGDPGPARRTSADRGRFYPPPPAPIDQLPPLPWQQQPQQQPQQRPGYDSPAGGRRGGDSPSSQQTWQQQQQPARASGGPAYASPGLLDPYARGSGAAYAPPPGQYWQQQPVPAAGGQREPAAAYGYAGRQQAAQPPLPPPADRGYVIDGSPQAAYGAPGASPEPRRRSALNYAPAVLMSAGPGASMPGGR